MAILVLLPPRLGRSGQSKRPLQKKIAQGCHFSSETRFYQLRHATGRTQFQNQICDNALFHFKLRAFYWPGFGWLVIRRPVADGALGCHRRGVESRHRRSLRYFLGCQHGRRSGHHPDGDTAAAGPDAYRRPAVTCDRGSSSIFTSLSISLPC